MNPELKQLVEDAAELLGLTYGEWIENCADGSESFVVGNTCFNPLDPERGDLMKVAIAAGIVLDSESRTVFYGIRNNLYTHLALAILRAASAVLRSKELVARGGV